MKHRVLVRWSSSALALALLFVPSIVVGQQLPPGYEGPPVAALPDTIARDAAGRVTVRAVRLESPLKMDGRLDEAVYSALRPISDFIQTEPVAGAPATERTEVWLLFDDDYLYVSARCYESHPERMIVNEMRRDGSNIGQQENIAFFFDTFYDKRNGFVFNVNPLGARADGQTSNERHYNIDWNPVWSASVSKFEGGWTVEAAIPFRSLRYKPGTDQLWGFNMRRRNRWKNEMSYITPIPNSLGSRGLYQGSLAALLVGIEAPSGSRKLELKPYAIADLTTDATVVPGIANDPGADIGLDLKYGVTQNLTADFTYNTDFAQVEADEQQVNLTRFSLFFPEKREFFLENQGTFAFGGASAGETAAGSDTPILFYSRRIGLDQGREVPIQAGGRLTGRVRRYSLGLLAIQSEKQAATATPATTFSVLRVKRDLMRRSSVGAIFTARSKASTAPGGNEAFGVDGTFGFFDNLTINTSWARTRTEGISTDDVSYRAHVEYTGDRYGVTAERLAVGDNFNPEVGFVRRDDMRKTYGQVRFSPRPKSIPSVRKFSWIGSAAHIEDGRGRLATRDIDAEFNIEFQRSDVFVFAVSDNYDFLPRPFRISSGVTLPVGAYRYASARTAYTIGQQRKVSGTLSAERGTFYNGTRTTVGFSRPRVEITPRLALEPSLSVNWVDLDQGSFRTTLVGTRVMQAITPRMFVGALVQYNSDSHSVAANVRLRWEYHPGSELFVVFNEQRDTVGTRFPDLTNRAFVVKINRLFRP